VRCGKSLDLGGRMNVPQVPEPTEL